jgi:hypothetical protein
MDRKHNPDRTNLHELDLTELTHLCVNVSINRSANPTQTDTAHALRMEGIQLSLDHSLRDGKNETEASLRERMVEFLSGVPAWMLSGV